LQRLALQAEPYTPFTQLTRANIQFKIVETQCTCMWRGARHVKARKSSKV